MSGRPKPGEGIFGWGAVVFALATLLAAGVAIERRGDDDFGSVDWVDAATSAAIVAGPFLLGGIVLMAVGAAVNVLRGSAE